MQLVSSDGQGGSAEKYAGSTKQTSIGAGDRPEPNLPGCTDGTRQMSIQLSCKLHQMDIILNTGWSYILGRCVVRYSNS